MRGNLKRYPKMVSNVRFSIHKNSFIGFWFFVGSRMESSHSRQNLHFSRVDIPYRTRSHLFVAPSIFHSNSKNDCRRARRLSANYFFFSPLYFPIRCGLFEVCREGVAFLHIKYENKCSLYVVWVYITHSHPACICIWIAAIVRRKRSSSKFLCGAQCLRIDKGHKRVASTQ